MVMLFFSFIVYQWEQLFYGPTSYSLLIVMKEIQVLLVVQTVALDCVLFLNMRGRQRKAAYSMMLYSSQNIQVHPSFLSPVKEGDGKLSINKQSAACPLLHNSLRQKICNIAIM